MTEYNPLDDILEELEKDGKINWPESDKQNSRSYTVPFRGNKIEIELVDSETMPVVNILYPSKAEGIDFNDILLYYDSIRKKSTDFKGPIGSVRIDGENYHLDLNSAWDMKIFESYISSGDVEAVTLHMKWNGKIVNQIPGISICRIDRFALFHRSGLEKLFVSFDDTIYNSDDFLPQLLLRIGNNPTEQEIGDFTSRLEAICKEQKPSGKFI